MKRKNSSSEKKGFKDVEAQSALVIVSHGSKRRASNDEFKVFIKKMEELNQKNNSVNKYTQICGACLEFASPQLETVVEELLNKGIKKIDLFPLFIFAGYHVKEDLPERMEALKKEAAELEYNILEHPAAAADFADFIYNFALQY